jgi:hypothetical protein
MITRLYILFLGLLLTLFVGVGIAAFYHGPKLPDPIPPVVTDATGQQKESPEQIRQNDRAQNDYSKASKEYNRNVSLIALAGAVLFVTLGLTLLKKLTIINDSLLLGGIFTLVYSIVRGFGAGDDAFRFILVTTSLVIAVTLGYFKLIKPQQPASKRK